jgi:metal-responsive CopG/Arc/MetJ family transcriptional regulator
MKTKTSITLSEDVLKAIEVHSKHYSSRSEFIETALMAFMAQIARGERNAKDLRIINRRAKRLNKEAADVLTYQVEL